jgi:phage terminase large subunit-like protein
MIASAPHHSPPKNIAGYDPTRDADAYWYDGEAAEQAVAFFADVLVHLDGENAGDPFHLEPWQADIVRTIYGWKRHSDGTRRYRTVFWFVPRKNGKTTIAAGLSLKALYADNERRAQCYCCAESREQSSVLFEMARDEVRANDELDSVSKVRDYHKRIIYRDRFLKAMAASDAGGHGLNVHFVVYDEFHLFRKQKHVEMHQSLHTATANRSQPLEVIITTAGWDRYSACYKEYQTSCQVRDGLINIPTHLPIIFEAGPEDDWTDEKTWHKANPNLGVTVSLDYLREECEKAKRDVSLENTFRRLHLNQWVAQETRWLRMDRWRECKVIAGDIPEGSEVFGGLDLSSNVDVTAWMIAMRDGNGWRLRGHYFIPEGRMREAEGRDRVPYSAWVRGGWVTATPGEAIDYSMVHDRILADSERYHFGVIGYDPWNAQPTRIMLENEGLTMLEMRQGAKSLNLPCRELERAIIERTLDHGNDPVLAWMAENVQVKTDENGNIRPVKPDHAGSAKRIDGIVAAVMAIGVGMITEPQPAGDFLIL